MADTAALPDSAPPDAATDGVREDAPQLTQEPDLAPEGDATALHADSSTRPPRNAGPQDASLKGAAGVLTQGSERPDMSAEPVTKPQAKPAVHPTGLPPRPSSTLPNQPSLEVGELRVNVLRSQLTASQRLESGQLAEDMAPPVRVDSRGLSPADRDRRDDSRDRRDDSRDRRDDSRDRRERYDSRDRRQHDRSSSTSRSRSHSRDRRDDRRDDRGDGRKQTGADRWKSIHDGRWRGKQGDRRDDTQADRRDDSRDRYRYGSRGGRGDSRDRRRSAERRDSRDRSRRDRSRSADRRRSRSRSRGRGERRRDDRSGSRDRRRRDRRSRSRSRSTGSSRSRSPSRSHSRSRSASPQQRRPDNKRGRSRSRSRSPVRDDRRPAQRARRHGSRSPSSTSSVRESGPSTTRVPSTSGRPPAGHSPARARAASPQPPLKTRASGSDMEIEEDRGEHPSVAPVPMTRQAPYGAGGSHRSRPQQQQQQQQQSQRERKGAGGVPYSVNDLVGSGLERTDWFRKMNSMTDMMHPPAGFDDATDFAAINRKSGPARAEAAPSGAQGKGDARAPAERSGAQRARAVSNAARDNSGNSVSAVQGNNSGSQLSSGAPGVRSSGQPSHRTAAEAPGEMGTPERAAPAEVAATNAPMGAGTSRGLRRAREQREARQRRARTPDADGGDAAKEETEPAGASSDEESGGDAAKKSVRVGPSEKTVVPSDPLDDLPYLALNMIQFSSDLLMGAGVDAGFGLLPGGGALLGVSGNSASSAASQTAARIGRPYKRDTLHKLLEDAKEVKNKGDRMVRNSKTWCPLALLKYLESGLMYLEAAYGHEQSPDRERGTSDSAALLNHLTLPNGMLRMAEQQATALLRSKKHTICTLQEEEKEALSKSQSLGQEAAAAVRQRYATQLQDAKGEAMALQALLALSQQILAVALTKLLMLRRDALSTAVDAISQAPGMAPDAGATATQPPGSGGNKGRASVHGSSSTGPVGAGGNGVQAQGNANAGAGAGRSTVSPPPADSASSTLEGVSSVPYTTWASSLQTLSSCMRQYGAVGHLWQQAATGARNMYREAAQLASAVDTTDSAATQGSARPDLQVASTQTQTPVAAGLAGAEGATQKAGEAVGPTAPSWARMAHVAAAQILSLGYEWGVWDLLGSVMVARQVLDTITHLPGVA